jgi:hypothetical protein
MDIETAKELLALIESKMARLQKSRDEIMGLVSAGKKEQDHLDLPIAATILGHSTGMSDNTKKVYETLLTFNKPASPRELFDKLRSTGFSMPDQRVRQILRRWKGRLFKSPKRGLWKAIKQEE